VVPSLKKTSLRRGLVHAVYQAGRAPVDVQRPNQSWSAGAGGAGTVTYMRRGKGLNVYVPSTTNVGYSFSGPTEDSRRISQWPATIICYMRREALTTTVDVIFGSRNTLSPFSNLAVLGLATEIPQVAYNAGGTAGSLSAAQATTVGQEIVFAAVIAPRHQWAYVNGQVQAEGTTTAGSGPTYGATRYFTWGGTGATVNLFHSIAAGYVYRRLLSSLEQRMIAANPLCVLQN